MTVPSNLALERPAGAHSLTAAFDGQRLGKELEHSMVGGGEAYD